MRIVWTKDEKRALLESMIDISHSQPKLSNKELLRRAQEDVIPPDRRVKITDQRVFNYKSMIHQAKDAAALAAKNPPRPRPAAPEPPPRKLDTLGEVFELFIDAVADRIVAKLEARSLTTKPVVAQEPESVDDKPLAFGRGWLDELEKLSIRSKEAKVRRPTALIVGLLGVQMECIKQSNPGVDFTFVTAEQALSHYTFNKDHTFLMTKFINHSVQSKYRKHPNLHFVNGGVSELKTLLHGIFYKKEAA